MILCFSILFINNADLRVVSQLQLARQSVERGQPIPPYLQKDGEAMYPQYAAKVKQLIACSDRLQEHQLRCEGATKIQALARGFLFRRRWAKLAKGTEETDVHMDYTNIAQTMMVSFCSVRGCSPFKRFFVRRRITMTSCMCFTRCGASLRIAVSW